MLSDPLEAVEKELLRYLSNSGCYEPSKYGYDEVSYLSSDMANYFLNAVLGIKGWYKNKVFEYKPKTFFVQEVIADDFQVKKLSNIAIEKADATLYQYILWKALSMTFSPVLIKKSGKPDLLLAFDKSKKNDNVLYYYDNDQILKPLNIKKMRDVGYHFDFDLPIIAKSLKGMLKFRRAQLAKVSVIVALEISHPNSRKKINAPKIA